MSGSHGHEREIAVFTLEQLEHLHGYKIDAILPDGTHRYWSTHCRHDRHGECAREQLEGWDAERPLTVAKLNRRPAQCKTCAAPCVCECHGGRER